MGPGPPSLLYVVEDCANITTPCVGDADFSHDPIELTIDLEKDETVFILIDGYRKSEVGEYELWVSDTSP